MDAAVATSFSVSFVFLSADFSAYKKCTYQTFIQAVMTIISLRSNLLFVFTASSFKLSTNTLLYNYRLCCVMENTEIWLADKCVKFSAISTWMSFWIRMNVILTRNAGTTLYQVRPVSIAAELNRKKTIDSKSIKTFQCLTERWYVAIIACCDVPHPCLLQ